jgi:tetratricopeptide (TPR) repeat protein
MKGVIIGFGLVATLAVNQPIPVHSEEVEVKKLAEWLQESENSLYNENNRFYCSNSLLFYYMGIPSIGFKKEAKPITLKNINASEIGDLIIWESHYGYRPKYRPGSLKDQYFSSRPNEFRFINQFIASDKRFQAKVYVKLTQSDTTLNKALEFYDKGKYDSTLLELNNVFAKHPNNARAYYMKGMCSVKLKKEKESINDFNKSISLNPNEIDAYGERGKILSKFGNHPQAILDLNRFIAKNSSDLESLFYRGSSLLNTGKIDLAKKDFESVIKLNAKAPGAYYNLGLAYVQSNNIAKSCENFKKAKELGLAQADAMIAKHCK